MTTEIETRIIANYKERAQAMKNEGWTVSDSDTFESLTIQSPVEHEYYEFRYDARDSLKEEQPDWLPMDFEDYILACATEW